MAQWNKDTQAYRAQDTTNFEVVMLANQYGDVAGATETATARSAFGETVVVPITPVVQLDALYGLDTNDFDVFNFNGTATTENNTFKVGADDSNANSYGVIRSKRFVRYRPGQGALARFTASFTATDGVGPTGFTQRAGFFNQEQALQIGFNTDGKFGILRANGGKAHIQELEFSALADGDVTVQINGTSFAAVTVAGGSVADNIAALVAGLQQQVLFNALYVVEYEETKIRFLATSLGPQNGTNNVTSATSVTFTSASLQEGLAQTETWIYQENFNLDTLDGNGPSGVLLDHTKLNVYQINFRWLGAGEMRYAVENPINGDMIFFHHEHYSNQYIVPHLDNPSMKIGYVAANLSGGTGTGSVTVRGASMLGAIEGELVITTNPQALTASRSSLNTANAVFHMLSIKNKLIYQNKINTRDILIRSISSACAATAGQPATVYVYSSPNIGQNLLWQDTGEFNTTLIAKNAATITNPPQPIAVFSLAAGGPLNIDVSSLNIKIPPQGYLTFGISSTGNMTAASLAANIIEV